MTDFAVATRALEYARAIAVPVEPLGAYVCAAETRFGERIANRIPWTRGAPHPAILTQELRLAVGWAPIASLIRAIEQDAPEEAARLRSLPPSDVPGRCPAGGEHDVAGPPYLIFGDAVEVAVDGRTCSKCGFDNVPPWASAPGDG